MTDHARCSYCGQPKADVRELAPGVDAWICSDCVLVCMSELEREPGVLGPSGRQHLVKFADGTVRVCARAQGWIAFEGDAPELEWSWATRDEDDATVVIVRRREQPKPVFGAPIPENEAPREDHARELGARLTAAPSLREAATTADAPATTRALIATYAFPATLAN